MSIKFNLLILVVFLSCFQVKAQQLPVQNNHFDLLNLYNPSAPNNIYTIIDGIYDGKTNFFKTFARSHWFFSGVKNGKPFTGGIDLERQLSKNKAWRIGGGMTTDQAGAINISQIATRINLELFKDNSKIDLSIGSGLKLGLANINFNKTDIRDNGDPLIFENTFENKNFISVPIGLFSKIFINDNTDILSGISVSRLINFQADSTLQFVQHYFGNLGALIQFKNKDPFKPQVHLEISSFFTYVNNTPMDYSGHIILHLKNNDKNTNISSFGIGYAKNSLQVEFQLFFKQKYGVGLTVDFLTVGKIQQYGGRYLSLIHI